MFENYKKATFDEIYDYVVKEQPDYLKTLTESVKTNKSFLTIKRDFYEKFFPQYKPVKKKPKQSMKEKLGLKKEEEK